MKPDNVLYCSFLFTILGIEGAQNLAKYNTGGYMCSCNYSTEML